MEDTGRTCRAVALLAACGRGVRGRRGASVIVPSGGSHRSAVDDGHAELVLTHIDHPESIIRNHALGIDGMFYFAAKVFVADVDAIFWRLGETNDGTCRKHYGQDLQDLLPHNYLLNSCKI